MENYQFSYCVNESQTQSKSLELCESSHSFILPDQTQFLEFPFIQQELNQSRTETDIAVSVIQQEQDKICETSGLKTPTNDGSQIKKIVTQQKTRRAFKKCQTMLIIGPIKHSQHQKEKIFVKKTNKLIENQFNHKKSLISNFTGIFVPNIKQHQKPVQVRYFRSSQTKVLIVDEDMLAIEFITYALSQYQNDQKFDQTLYLYSNFTLAYQLEGQDDQQDVDDYQYRKPIQRIKSFVSVDGIQKSRTTSQDGIDIDQKPVSQAEISISQEDDDRIIQIDSESPMRFYKSVDVVPITDSSQIEITLEMITIFKKQMPHYLIILVEDPINKNKYHCKATQNQLVEDIFQQLIQKQGAKYPKSDYYLCLKYPCLHFGTEPLNPKMPIKNLPIHYLTLTTKFIYSNNKLLTQGTESFTPNMNKDTIYSKSINKSYRYLQDDEQIYSNAHIISKQYSYEEFNLILYDEYDGSKNNVILGIDYFDLYYTIIGERQRSFKIMRFVKQLVKLFFEGLNLEQKDYRRISITQIQNIDYNKEIDQIAIIYEKSFNYHKRIVFGIDKTEDKIHQQLQKKNLSFAWDKLEVSIQNSENSKFNDYHHDSIDKEWLNHQLEKTNQYDQQNLNIQSNTDVSEIVQKESHQESDCLSIQKNIENEFTLTNFNKQFQEQQQPHCTIVNKYTEEFKRANYKKYKTSVNGFFFDTLDPDLTLIMKSPQQKIKKSPFSKQLQYYKQKTFIKINVSYFGISIKKTILIDQEMNAAEFIVYALKQYEKDKTLDQSKYEYPNCSLAYKLVGSETSPRKYTYNNDENFDNDSEALLDESLEKADVDLESQVFYDKVELILTDDLLGISFEDIKQTYKIYPQYIILRIEDIINKDLFYIKVPKNGILKDGIKQIAKHIKNKQKIHLTFKHTCLNYDLEEIDETFPISKLPIHWLVIQQKSDEQFRDESSKSDISIIFGNTKTLNQLQYTQEGFQSHQPSLKILSDHFQLLKKSEKLNLLYSYQEYDLIRLKGKQQNEIIFGLDYFDIYYRYKQNRPQNKSTIKLILQNIVDILFYENQNHSIHNDYKRIPLSNLTGLNKLSEDKGIVIEYQLQDGFTKSLILIPTNYDKKSIEEVFIKLEYLVQNIID